MDIKDGGLIGCGQKINEREDGGRQKSGRIVRVPQIVLYFNLYSYSTQKFFAQVYFCYIKGKLERYY